MPLTGEYKWNESNDTMKISIPLKGVSTSKVDILVSELTLKVNYAPYLIDIVLLKEVNELRHKAVVKEGVLHVTLFKKVEEIWGECERKDTKSTLNQIRTESLKKRELLEQEIATKKSDRRVEEERHAVRKQMALEEAERGRLDNVKLEEKKSAEQEVYETFARMQVEEQKKMKTVLPTVASPKTIPQQSTPKPVQPAVITNTTSPVSPGKVTEIFDDYDMLSDVDSDVEKEVINKKSQMKIVEPIVQPETENDNLEEDIKYIPPPRNALVDEETGEIIDANADAAAGKVKINFTPRIFPTPMRESKIAEEEDWVAKNRRHLKRHGVLGKGLGKGADISEEDPTWLKAKADDFFRSGDTRSALNAYSAAIDMDNTFIACYSNRATCYLKLNMYPQCQADCDFAITHSLEELQRRASDNSEKMKLLSSLVKLHLRRCSAFCQMGQYQESLNDYYQALTKYQHLDASMIASLTTISVQSIQSDIDRLKTLSHAEILKKEADTLFAEKDIQKALEKYNAAITLIPVHVSALSNRSGCKLALGLIESAIDDCKMAVDLLILSAKPLSSGSNNQLLITNGQMKNMLNAVLPPPDSDKRKLWLLKTLLRKAVALTQIDRLEEAITDYEMAVEIDPTDDKIKADLANLRKLLESKELKE